MILESAEIRVVPGTAEAFVAAVEKAVPIFGRAKGCRGMQLRQSVEDACVFVLLVQWETLENHIVDFRGSEDIKLWRALVADYWDGQPRFSNYRAAVEGF